MLTKEKYEILQKSSVFTEWKEKNANSYLAHIFRMFDEANQNIWQFGYYNSDDTITTFILENDTVNEVPEQQIFKKDDHKLAPLNLDTISIDFDQALEIAKKKHEEKYAQHPIMKSIAILQIVEQVQLYNITFVTKTFNTLNIRVDASSSEIVHEQLISLMEMAKVEKGGKSPDYIG